MTELPLPLATIENGLDPAMVAQFERIKVLARNNRAQYARQMAVQKAARKGTRAAPAGTGQSKRKRKAGFYNPAHRD